MTVHIETILGELFLASSAEKANEMMFKFIADTGVPCRLIIAED